jgi:predicted alpha/beta hydrolase family esterase
MSVDRPEMSTTVRVQRAPVPVPPPSAPPVPGWLRLAFAATGTVAPPLAASAAAWLFCRPPRPRRRRGRAGGLGEPFTVRGAGERLRAWRAGAGPAVLLVHGWGSRGAHLSALVSPIVEAGCTAVVFDAPAHGASSGRTAAGVTFAQALTAVARRVEARAAVGHSLGAAALGWAMGHGLRLDAAVFLSPPRGVTSFVRRFSDALALSPALEAAVQERFRRRFGITTHEFDPCLRAGEGTRNLLVVHDADDREVPWEEGAAVARDWPGAILETTGGLGHRGVVRDPRVAARVAGFVGAHLARCACGRPAAGEAAEGPACGRCALERELYHRPRRWIVA